MKFIVFVESIYYFVCPFIAGPGETNSNMFLNVLGSVCYRGYIYVIMIFRISSLLFRFMTAKLTRRTFMAILHTTLCSVSCWQGFFLEKVVA